MQLNKRVIATLMIPAFLGQTVAIPAWAAMESLSAPLPAELAELTTDLRDMCEAEQKKNPDAGQIIVKVDIGDEEALVDCTEALRVIAPTVETRAGAKGADCVNCALNAGKANTGAESMAKLAAEAVRAAAKPEAAEPPQPKMSCPSDPDAEAQDAFNACLADNAALVLPEETLPPEASVTARFKTLLYSAGKPSNKLDACREASGVSGTAAGAAGSCAWKAVSEALVGIFSAIPGIKDLIFGVGKFVAVGVKKLFTSIFGTNAPMENIGSEKSHAAAATPPDLVEQIYSDLPGTLANLAKGMFHLMTNYIDLKAKSMGCKKWSGVPDESECLAGTGGYACMTAKQKNDVWCAGTGAFVGNFLLGSVGIGAVVGLGGAIVGGVKGAVLASKTKALLKGATASSQGKAASSALTKAIDATMKVARSKPAAVAFKTAKIATKPIVVTAKGTIFAAKWTGAKIKRAYEILKKIPVAGDVLSGSVFVLKTIFVTADNYGMAFGAGLFGGKGGMAAVRAYRATEAAELASKLRQQAGAAQDAVKATTLAEVRIPVLQEELNKLPANSTRRADIEKEIAAQNKILATAPVARKNLAKAEKVATDAENAVLKPLSRALEKNEGIKTKIVEDTDGQRVLEVVGASDGSPLAELVSTTRKVTQRGNPIIGDSVPNGRVLVRTSAKTGSDAPAITISEAGNYVVDPAKAVGMNAEQWMKAVSEAKTAKDMERAGFGSAPELTRAVVASDTLRQIRDEADSIQATRTLVGDNSAKPVFVQPTRAELDRALATSNTQFVDAVSQVARQAGNRFERLPNGDGIVFLPDATTGAGKLADAVGSKAGTLGPDDLRVVMKADNSAGTTYLDGTELSVGQADFFNQKRLDDLAKDVMTGCRVK